MNLLSEILKNLRICFEHLCFEPLNLFRILIFGFRIYPLRGNMDISIVILNYKSKGLVRMCLRGLQKFAPRHEHEIIVVDNDSKDGIAKMIAYEFPQVRCIMSSENIGFGAGNNIGIREARGRYVMVMNPDTVIMDYSIDQLVEAMDANPEIGIMGPRLQNPDGSRQHSCYRFPKPLIPVYRRTLLGKTTAGKAAIKEYLMEDWDHSYVRDVDWLLGASLVLRQEMIEKIGIFDDRFFMYLEDTDLCRRAWNAGYRVTYNPEITIVHYHKRESSGSPFKFFTNYVVRAHVLSGFKYFLKYRGGSLPR